MRLILLILIITSFAFGQYTNWKNKTSEQLSGITSGSTNIASKSYWTSNAYAQLKVLFDLVGDLAIEATDTTALKAMPADTSLKFAFLRQFSSANDNGGGLFVFMDSTSILNLLGGTVTIAANKATIFSSSTSNYFWVREEFLSRQPFNFEWTGASGKSYADVTTEFNTAVDIIVTKHYNSDLIIPMGDYGISETINLLNGFRIIGTGSRSGNIATLPQIKWLSTTVDDTMFVVGSNGMSRFGMENISLDGIDSCMYGVYLKNRLDAMSVFDRVQVTKCNFGIWINNGCLNGYFNNFRTDGCDSASVYYKNGGVDRLTLSNFTTDNYAVTSPSPGSSLIIDFTDAGVDNNLRISLRDARLEYNASTSMPAIYIKNNINGNKRQVVMSLHNVYVAKGASTNVCDLKVDPPTEHNVFEFFATALDSVVGIPSYSRNYKLKTNNDVAKPEWLFINPNTETVAASPASAQGGMQIITDVFLEGPVYQSGKIASSIIYADPDSDNYIYPRIAEIGQWFYDATNFDLEVVTARGTLGNNPNVTGTISSGSTNLVVSEPDSFKIGEQIYIDATDSRKVTNIKGDTLAISSAASDNFTDVDITYVQPTLQTYYMDANKVIKGIQFYPTTADSFRFIMLNATDATKDTSQWIGLH